MRNYQIILQMIRTVENYIMIKKNIKVKIDHIQIMTNEDQLNKLKDAYNFIENGKA